ncbi:hypothetical protein [Kordia sp. SMS9]|uniref:hypothetical protein n=1 Tax=Kordia sp. SMS9 TaxID=2282170 RepID=UPI000E0D1B77|nr:hypothetical protein [Kordia sp. SMS9]
MKKQKLLLKKLQLSKSKVSNFSTHQIVGGSFLCVTDTCCGPPKSVYPDICPVSDGCPNPSDACPSAACHSFDCQTIVGCTTDAPTLACW